MSAQFTLGYDPTNAKQGFKVLADAIRAAEKAGAKLPPELLSIVERTEQAARAADKATKDTDEFQKEIDQLTAAVDRAGNELGSFAVSTSQFGKSADKAGQQVDKTNKTIARGKLDVDGVKDAFGGLDATMNALGLGSFALLASQSEMLFKGFKDFQQAGTLGSVAAALGSVAAIAGSAYILWKDYAEVTEDVADKNSLLDGTLLSVAHSLGIISEETKNVAEANKEADKFAENFASRMKAAGNAAIAASKSIADGVTQMESAILEARESQRRTSNLANQNDAEELGRVIDGIIAETKRLAAEGKLTQEQLASRTQQVNEIEQRRLQIIEEQKQKQAEADAAAKKGIEDNAKAREESDKKRAAAQGEQDKKDAAAALAEEKRIEDSNRKIIDKMNERKEKIEEVKEAESAPSQPQAEASNPYGEGEAPTAGQDSFGQSLLNELANPFGAVAPQGGAAPQPGQPAEQGGGTLDDFLKQVRDATVGSAGDRNKLARSAASDDEEKYKQFVKDLKDGQADDPELRQAQTDMVNKNLEAMKANGDLSAEFLSFAQQSVRETEQIIADQIDMGNRMKELEKALGKAGSKKNGGDFGPIRDKAQRLSKGY